MRGKPLLPRSLFFTCLLLVAPGLQFAADDEAEPPYIPYDVRDAVIALGELMAPEWDKLTPKEKKSALKPGLMQVRNLWIHGGDKSPRLKNYFRRKGIYNADLMSDVIWQAYEATMQQRRFDVRALITHCASYPTYINCFTPDESYPLPPSAGHLWRAYLIQKDDQTAIHVFCDDSAALRWTYDPDGGWAPVSDHHLEVIRQKRAIRLNIGMGDDGQMPLAKAIQRVKNPPPEPVGGPFGPR